MEYTKGEWYIWHTNNAGDIIQTTKRQIASVVPGSYYNEEEKAEAAANANLISAAPAMYEALKLYQSHQEGKSGHYCWRCAEAVNKALAKAEAAK